MTTQFTPDLLAYISRPAFIERFWNKIDKRGDCWCWTGKRRKGYGRVFLGTVRKGVHRYMDAHRIAYVLTRGPIPEGMCIMHSCDNPPCCRPDHICLGTHADNMRDMAEKGRAASGDRSGVRLHPESFRHGEESSTSKLTMVQVEDMRRRYVADGAPQEALARDYGVSRSHVSRLVNGKAWSWMEASDTLPHKEQCIRRSDARAKLSSKDVPIIRLRAASGEKHGALAKEYGVSRTAIWSVVHRKTFRAID